MTFATKSVKSGSAKRAAAVLDARPLYPTKRTRCGPAKRRRNRWAVCDWSQMSGRLLESTHTRQETFAFVRAQQSQRYAAETVKWSPCSTQQQSLNWV